MNQRFLLLFSVSSNEKDLQAIKEDLAYYCEKFGDISLIDIQESISSFQQIEIGDIGMIRSQRERIAFTKGEKERR